jgi:hypothetical protein
MVRHRLQWAFRQAARLQPDARAAVVTQAGQAKRARHISLLILLLGLVLLMAVVLIAIV